MIKCDNCSSDALYYVTEPGANSVHYCGICLPSWLKVRADEGHFSLVPPLVVEEPVVEPVVEAKPKKKAADPVDENN